MRYWRGKLSGRTTDVARRSVLREGGHPCRNYALTMSGSRDSRRYCTLNLPPLLDPDRHKRQRWAVPRRGDLGYAGLGEALRGEVDGGADNVPWLSTKRARFVQDSTDRATARSRDSTATTAPARSPRCDGESARTCRWLSLLVLFKTPLRDPAHRREQGWRQPLLRAVHLDRRQAL